LRLRDAALEEWTGDRSGGVDFFAASDFIGMLRPGEAGEEGADV
jgi:hypothetical protein